MPRDQRLFRLRAENVMQRLQNCIPIREEVRRGDRTPLLGHRLGGDTQLARADEERCEPVGRTRPPAADRTKLPTKVLPSLLVQVREGWSAAVTKPIANDKTSNTC